MLHFEAPFVNRGLFGNVLESLEIGLTCQLCLLDVVGDGEDGASGKFTPTTLGTVPVMFLTMWNDGEGRKEKL